MGKAQFGASSSSREEFDLVAFVDAEDSTARHGPYRVQRNTRGGGGGDVKHSKRKETFGNVCVPLRFQYIAAWHDCAHWAIQDPF